MSQCSLSKPFIVFSPIEHAQYDFLFKKFFSAAPFFSFGFFFFDALLYLVRANKFFFSSVVFAFLFVLLLVFFFFMYSLEFSYFLLIFFFFFWNELQWFFHFKPAYCTLFYFALYTLRLLLSLLNFKINALYVRGLKGCSKKKKNNFYGFKMF